MIHTFCHIPDQPPATNIPVKEFANLLKNPEALLWVDFENEPDPSAESILTGIFRFHPLAVDDALVETHIPKVDDWGSYIYIVLNALNLPVQDSLTLRISELDVFLGPNYIVTHHDQPIPAIQKIIETCQRDQRHITQGADHLLYKILDELVADHMPLIETIDEHIDRIENEVLNHPQRDTQERIFALKRALLTMRRIITPQREVLNKLARDEYEVIDPKDRIFFRDIYDHLVRLHDLNESMRDLVNGALDTYLSVINNRMNEIMKTLTTITTLFMPISFLTGFFGMNFFEPVAGLTAWTSQSAFLIVMGIFIFLPIAMFLWMRRQTWL